MCTVDRDAVFCTSLRLAIDRNGQAMAVGLYTKVPARLSNNLAGQGQKGSAVQVVWWKYNFIRGHESIYLVMPCP